MSREPAPARPPDARLTTKNRQKSVLGEYLGKMALIVSLNAKLKACGEGGQGLAVSTVARWEAWGAAGTGRVYRVGW